MPSQMDRDAAAMLYLKLQGDPLSLHDRATSVEIQMGKHDDWPEVEAFAAHADAALERAAQVAYDRLAPASDLTDDELTERGKQRKIAAMQAQFAIRAMKSGEVGSAD